jgi:uncharacterized membrane protein YphA (DoxX/SURF4 family)
MLRTSSTLAPLLFRWMVVGAQAATIGLTWPVWQTRTMPPMLPALDVPALDMGWPLLASLALVLAAPRWGVVLHGALLLAAITMDQMRLQPEFISLWTLILATLPVPGAQLIGRMHLVSLWFFSGFHKLFSAGYYEMMHARLWQRLLPASESGTDFWLSLLLAVLEMLLGVLALLPRTRRLAAIVALPIHAGIIGLLYFLDWNWAVWPWNVALAGAGFGLLWSWRESVLTDLAAVRWPAKIAACILVVSPLGYYLGVVDAYLAYSLYSANIPVATWNGGQIVASTMYRGPQDNPNQLYIGVPIPPTHRTYEAFFHALARPGDKLEIHDPRWCAKEFGYADRVIVQP